MPLCALVITIFSQPLNFFTSLFLGFLYFKLNFRINRVSCFFMTLELLAHLVTVPLVESSWYIENWSFSSIFQLVRFWNQTPWFNVWWNSLRCIITSCLKFIIRTGIFFNLLLFGLLNYYDYHRHHQFIYFQLSYIGSIF